MDWPRVIPFIALHVGCAAVVWVGWSWTAVIVAVAAYLIRMFAITGFITVTFHIEPSKRTDSHSLHSR